VSSSRPSLLHRLRRRLLLDPAGYGRPMDRATADNEYRSGAWDHFHQLPELPRQRAVVGFVSQLHPNPAILDLGCGSGSLAQLLQALPFRRYLGVDLSPEGLRLARGLKLRGCEFVEGDFESWTPAEKFDVIIFSECIGYADDPGLLVARFLPWLAPDGAVIVSYFRSGHWEARWRRVERHVHACAHDIVINDHGSWDIKLLRPPSPA